MRGKRGVSLGTVLIMVSLLVTAGFALSALSISHLQIGQRQSDTMQAENLARSVVAQAWEKIVSQSSHEFGKDRLATDSVDMTLGGTRPGSWGRLSFFPTQAQSWKIRYSTNNLAGSTSQNGDGKAVPPAGLHLIGVGQCGAARKQVEAVYHVPPFPFAVASAGPIVSTEGLTIGSLKALPGGPVSNEALLPADIQSNWDQQAISLQGPSHVSGDLKAVGSIYTSDKVEVLGAKLAPVQAITLPTIDFAQYDPRLLGISFDGYTSNYPNQVVVTGAGFSPGSMTISSGGLKLEGGLLYVAGDLTIQGGISGKGILAVEGNLRVNGRSQVEAQDQVSILVGQNLTLTGAGSLSSYLQGTVLTGGAFSADSATLVGALVAGGSTTLKDSRVIQVEPQKVTITLGGITPPPVFVALATATAGDSDAGELTFRVQVQGTQIVCDLITPGFVQPINSVTQASLDYLAAVQNVVTTSNLPSYVKQAFLSGGLAPAIAYQLEATIAQQNPGPDPTPTGSGTTITLDPNQFFSLEDKMRIVFWSEE